MFDRAVRHPGIWQVGEALDVGGMILLRGWGFMLCAAQCPCHRNPAGGGLVVDDDEQNGLLGLVTFTSPPCGCCEPWTADELVAIRRDLADVAWMEAQPG